MTSPSSENRAPNKPTLADHHWRLSLHAQTPETLESQLLAAVEAGNGWRFNILMQLDLAWINTNEIFRAALLRGQTDMFMSMTAKNPAWPSAIAAFDCASIAAESGHVELLDYIVRSAGIDIHQDREQLLTDAASEGQAEVVKYLLRSGADPTENDGYPLYLAAQGGHLGVVRALIESGMDPNTDEGSHLRTALSEGQMDVVRYLLSVGTALSEENKKCALDAAADEGREDVLRFMLAEFPDMPQAHKNAAFLSAVNSDYIIAAEILLEGGAEADAGSGAALRRAVINDSGEMVELLLVHGAAVNYADRGSTALTTAAEFGRAVIAEKLVDAGADPTLFGNAAIKAARAEGHEDLERFLLRAARHKEEENRALRYAEVKSLLPENYSLDDMRALRNALGEPALLIAADTRKFAELVRAAKGGSRPDLLPEDLFHPDDRADCVLSVLLRQKSLDQFFATDFWVNQTEALARALELMPEELRKIVNLNAIVAAHNQKTLQENRSRNNPPRLKP